MNDIGGMPARNADPSGHLVPSPFLGLACALIVKTRFLKLAMFILHFFTSNTPWYFLDFAYHHDRKSLMEDQNEWDGIPSFQEALGLQKHKEILKKSLENN